MNFTPMSELPPSTKASYESLPAYKFSYDDGYYSKKFFSPFMPTGGMLRTLTTMTTQRMSTSSSALNVTNIHGVEIRNNGVRYLFGYHADQQGSARNITEKSSDDVTAGNIKLQKFFAATMRLAFPKPGKYRIRGIVMMPVSAFQSDVNFKDNVKQAIVGLHTFEALTGFVDGVPVYEQFEFFVDKIAVLEQPLGALYRVALAEDGDYEKFIGQHGLKLRTTFLDWGSGTLDVFTVDNMSERIDYMSRALPAGISVMYDAVRQQGLPDGVNPTPLQLEAAIMAGRYQDTRHEKHWTAEALANDGFIDLKPYIKNGLDAMWELAQELFDDTIGLTAEGIHNIFLTGGAAGWMEPYVLAQFGERRVFKVLPETPTINPSLPYEHLMRSTDLHLRNAEGGYLYAQKLPND